MSTVNLYLKNPDAKPSKAQIEIAKRNGKKAMVKTAIRAVISDGRGVSFKVYSKKSIQPKHWSKTYQKVNSGNPDAVVLNDSLTAFKNKVISVYDKAKLEGIEITNEYLKNQVFPPPTKTLSFWDIWGLFIESKEGTTKKRTIAKYNALKTHINDFEKHKKLTLDLAAIDQTTLELLQTYLSTKKNLNTQSTEKYIRDFKTFLKWTIDRKYSTNTDYRAFKTTKQPDSLKVILTKEDIEKLESVDLGTKNYLRNAKELLILSCLTGLRFSDYSRVEKQHHKLDSDNNEILQIRLNKGENFVEIPLATNKAKEVVRKLVNGETHHISNAKMNKYAKELCKLAKIDELFEVHNYQGKESTVELKPKYELVTTHTGRRTFATNLLIKGVPAETVMQFTGHKDYKSFAKYVNIPKTAQKKAMREAMIRDEPVMKVVG